MSDPDTQLPAAEVIRRPPWRGWIAEPFTRPELERFVADPPALFALPEARLIKASRNRLTRVRPAGGAERFAWVVKEFSNRRPLAFLQNAWRTSKALKGWEKARALLARGLPTPQPRLALERRGPLGLLVTSVLVVDDLGEAVQIRQVFKDLRAAFRCGETAFLSPHGDRIDRAAFLESLAGLVRRMHDAGVLHRDLSGGNILICFAPGGRWTFSLVDINRARITPALAPEERLLDLERVNVAPEDRALFFAAYGAGSEALRALEPAYARCVERYRQYREGHGALAYKLTRYLRF